MGKKLRIITVCGVGMGSSLILRMWTEDVLKKLGIPAKVEASDAAQARGADVDLVLTSPALVATCSGGKGEVIGIHSFTNHDEIEEKLLDYLKRTGWVEE